MLTTWIQMNLKAAESFQENFLKLADNASTSSMREYYQNCADMTAEASSSLYFLGKATDNLAKQNPVFAPFLG